MFKANAGNIKIVKVEVVRDNTMFLKEALSTPFKINRSVGVDFEDVLKHTDVSLSNDALKSLIFEATSQPHDHAIYELTQAEWEKVEIAVITQTLVKDFLEKMTTHKSLDKNQKKKI